MPSHNYSFSALAPSDVSSEVPSDITSLSPSTVPIMPTSFSPSVSIISTETMKPSIQPASLKPVYEFEDTVKSVRGVTMVLSRNAQAIEEAQASDSNCTVIWQDAIRVRIQTEAAAVIPMHETIDVSMIDISRSSNFSSISLTFDAIVAIRSAVRNVDANRFIKGPFDSQSEKDTFIQFLASTLCPEFENIATMEIIIPSEVNATPTQDGDTSSDDKQLFLGLFIAVGTGCGAILVGASLIAFVRMKQRRKIIEADHASMTSGNKKEHPIASTPSYIERSNGGTDISTLGDPIAPGSFVKSNDIEASTVCSEEYDYKRAYLDLVSMTESNTVEPYQQVSTSTDDLHSVNDIVSTTGERVRDNIITETEYSVSAPPGLLGLILESSSIDGRSIVNSVKPFSPLADQVQVGDRLVLVDNEDVSLMTASKVSQLIASKQNETRILTFKRRLFDGSNGVC